MSGGYAGPAATDLEPDDDCMFRFLSWWFEKCHHGAIELCWRDPVSGRMDLIRRFALDDINSAVRFAAETNVVPGCSVYFRPATVRLNSKNTTDRDIVEIPGGWGDCDQRVAVQRVLAVDRPLPSAQVVTGRMPDLRAQFYYKLSGEPILDGESSRHLNRQVHALSGGDGAVVNPSTLMRLPGSIAWPWKPERQPELTEWCTPDGGGETYTLDALHAALPPVEAAAAPGRLNGHAGIDGDAGELLNPIRHLLEQVKAGPLWHEPLLRLVAMLIARRTPACVIEAMAPALTRPGYTEAQTVAELRTMIDGAMRKGYAPDPGDDDGTAAADDVADVMDVRPPGVREKVEVDPAVSEVLCATTWANLDIKPDERLLGDFITSTTRAFLVGYTGLGKTLLVYALAAGMGTGTGFLDWKCDRASRWLIIDGEMPSALVKTRAADMISRAGGATAFPRSGVLIYSRDRAEEFAKMFPALGELAPLNTAEGHDFVHRLIDAIGGVDGIIYDNLMSLAPGDQKDEDTFAGVIPLIESVGHRGIAQLFCDHTGHAAGRQYRQQH